MTIRRTVHPASAPARPRRPARRLRVESLEHRLAPATFSGTGPNLTIDLNSVNEVATFTTDGTTVTVTLTNGTANTAGTGGNVTGNGTATATFSSATYNGTVTVTDSAAGTSVAFANSTGDYQPNLSIVLNDAASGNVTFAGSSDFSSTLTASTTAGFIASDPASSLVSAAGGGISLSAPGHDILLAGALEVNGQTNLTGNVIQADNPGNDFVGALSLSAPVVVSIFDVNDLTLAASTLAFGPLGQTSRITANGNITQTGALTATAAAGTEATLAVTSNFGSISLTNAGNNIATNVALALSVSGPNTATVVNTAGLQLGDVTLGTGALTLTFNGNLTQHPGTTIQTGGSVSLTVDTGANRNVNLGNAGNRIAGPITIAEINGGDVRDVTIRNAFDNALPPTGTPLTTAGDVRNLTLFFDNNGVALPGYTLGAGGNLTVTAGGDVTQAATLTVPQTTTVTVLGDFGIALTSAGNALSGAVSLNDPQSTQPVAVVNGGALVLGPSNLGRGTFAATAATGTITQAGGIVQEKGTLPATFTVTAGAAITLSDSNRFPASVVLAGPNLNTVSVRNTDFQATFGQFTFPATVTNLTVTFDNAPIVLPGLTIPNLTVNAQGIIQQPGSALAVGAGTFSAGAFPLDLSNPGNDFGNLTVANSGRNAVAIADANTLTFVGNSTVGTGRLTVTAGGITTTGAGRISQPGAAGPVGDAVLTATAGGISLPNNDAFRGPVSVTVSGANTATIHNNNVPLVLGAVTTGTGSFTVDAGAAVISQDPNSVLALGGPSSFTAAGTVTLTNRTNTFGGPVALNAGSALVRATGAVVLAAGNVATTLSVQTGGAATDSVTQTGAVTGGSDATFDAGAGDVVLTNAANDFGTVSVASTGATVSVTDANALNVGTVVVGGGSLTLKTGGTLGTAAGGSIVQTTGTGAVTLTTPPAADINLISAANSLRGPVTVTGSTNVSLRTRGDLTFSPASAVSGTFTAIAGGTLTLPSVVNVAALNLSATSTTVPGDVTASGPVSLSGAVHFTGNRILASGGDVFFDGDVTAGGTLSLFLPAAGTVTLAEGTWDQGANALTVNGAGVAFEVGDDLGAPARLIMAGGTLSMPGNGPVSVLTDGTFQVGANPAAAETVTVANGTGSLTIDGTLAVGFGATNDELVKTGDGIVQIDTGARLVGSGLAGSTASPVLASQTALIVGRFANSADADDNPHDFFAGGDIVTPAYSFVDLTVKAGGVAAPTGIAVGTLPDGDRFSVKSSLGAAAGLATVVDLSGNLDVVVRNTTAASASTLTLTALGGGDGQLPVGGLAVHAPGAVTVAAPAANFTGDLTTAGTLTALTARDLGAGAPFTLADGGLVTGTTTLTARVVQNTTATVAGPLKTFKAVSANGTSLTARSFGTLTTTGLAAVGDRGNFNATLTSTTPATGPVVAAATVAGFLDGTWDVRGSVGTVKAANTLIWHLGTAAGANVRNGGGMTNVTSLALGAVSGSTVNATGAVAGLTATDVSNSTFTAGSWGTVKVAADPAHRLVGNANGLTLTATGNAAGVGLKGLTVAGDLSSSTVTLLNGDATAVTVGRTVNGSTITATDTGTRGTLKAVTASGLTSAVLDARSVGTLTVKPNLAAGLFGDVTGSTVTARANALGVGLGTFSAAGSVTGSTFDVQSGNLTKVAVARSLGTTTVRLPDPAFGTLGTIQAGDWAAGVTVLAETIGTAASVGAAAVLPASPLLLGGFASDVLTAYQNSGTAAAVGKLTAKGDLSASTVTAERGIGTVAVGRTVSNSFLVADDAQAGAPAVGLVKTLTAGAWNASTAAANTLGTVRVTGYNRPEGTTASFVSGDVTAGTFTAAGAPGVTAFAVAGQFQNNSLLKAPFGVKTLTVGGSVTATSKIVAANPAVPTAGALPAVTVGELNGSTVRAGSIGTLKVTGNVAAGLLGSVTASTIAATSTAAGKGGPLAIGSLAVAGDVTDSVLDAPAAVGSIAVGGRVASSTGGTRIQAGYNAGGKLSTLSAGAWGLAGATLTTDLVTRAVGTFAVKGNPARGFVGTTDRGFIDILGNSAGVGLGTFTGTGTATNSLFRVSDGDVGSFTVLRFLSSDLLVGFRPVKGSDLTLAPAAANWAATNHKLGSFTTTAAFDPADPADPASFRDSTVVAAVLGTVSISGVDPTDPTATTFGVAFRTAAGATAKGTVKKGGVALAPGAADGQFHYLGLPG